MKFENETFQKIWDLALPYQDKRDDEGHAEAVVKCAQEILKSEPADAEIVIPAAILHDIGWSKVPKNEAMLIFGKVSVEERTKIQKKHETYGVELAGQILEKVNYSEDKIDNILEIIDGHDTRKGRFFSKEDGIVRDSDKFGGRFSIRAFGLDLKRWNQTPKERADYIRENYLKDPGFFYFDSSKRLANEELIRLEKKFEEE